MIIKVAVTGGFGTGKTTVVKMFERLGAKTTSADGIVHGELRRNARLKALIGRLFGPGVLGRGGVRRQALARRVFASKGHIEKLNALIHPIVARRLHIFFKRWRDAGAAAVCVVEVPLLFESGFDRFFDVTVAVAADASLQRRRLARRFTKEDLRARPVRQMPLRQKLSRADFIIDNNGTRRETFRQVKALMGTLRRDDRK